MNRIGFSVLVGLTVSLAAAPCFGFIVSGTITDTSGDTVAGARVTFTREMIDPPITFSATTGMNGMYRIDTKLSVDENLDGTRPSPIRLMQNYPNPFNPSTIISFSLSAAGTVTLDIYNSTGQKIAVLFDGCVPAGTHSIQWNGRDNGGRRVSSGVYFYRLKAGNQSETKKMLVLDGGFSLSSGLGPSGGSVEKRLMANMQVTYCVTITGDGFAPFRESGVVLGDGGIYDFRVRRYDITFVSIPGGKFLMGDVENIGMADEKPVHDVTVSGFEMSVCEITNERYCQFLNDALSSGDITLTGTDIVGVGGVYGGMIYINLIVSHLSYPESRCRISYGPDGFVVEGGYEDWPITWVSWYGAKAFAVYYGLDLPTEAEWEYACRGGRQYRYGTDDGTLSMSRAYYWVKGTVHSEMAGSYPKNPYGLCDMSGNVWEWCRDWYGYYQQVDVSNPMGPDRGDCRVSRGGGWSDYDFVNCCRAAYRGFRYPNQSGCDVGFRVVRKISQWSN